MQNFSRCPDWLWLDCGVTAGLFSQLAPSTCRQFGTHTPRINNNPHQKTYLQLVILKKKPLLNPQEENWIIWSVRLKVCKKTYLKKKFLVFLEPGKHNNYISYADRVFVGCLESPALPCAKEHCFLENKIQAIPGSSSLSLFILTNKLLL